MDDRNIVALYWSRDERAISETDAKYGRMLRQLAERILRSAADGEEILNDSYLAAWNSMPDNRPDRLGGYMAKITRNLSLNRRERDAAEKRGGGAVLAELSECIPGGTTPVEEYENDLLRKAIERFLYGLDREKRVVFVKRYFFSESLAEIAHETGLSEPKLKSMLHRLRLALREALTREEVLR